MLVSLPSRMLDSSAYMFERSHSWRSGRPETAMSLFHRSCQAAACSENSCDHPLLAACCDADTAELSGLLEVSAVSTPTYLTNWYELPEAARKLTASLADRFAAFGLRLLVDLRPAGWGGGGGGAPPPGGGLLSPPRARGAVSWGWGSRWGGGGVASRPGASGL